MFNWFRQWWQNMFILKLELSSRRLDTLSDNLPQRLKILWCSNNQLTALPDNLPQSLQKLNCSKNQLITLPNNLPQSLQILSCSYNQLITLPNNLPQSLQELYCMNNNLTFLPDNLPPHLKYLYCDNNQLTILPDKLPQSLQKIACYDNQLTALPDNLPRKLDMLMCHNNKLTILPDLPNSLIYFKCINNSLEINYPKIHTFKLFSNTKCYDNPYEVVMYVNECNSRRRAQERAHIIEKELADHYYRKVCNPRNLAPLLENPEMDPNDFLDHLSENI